MLEAALFALAILTGGIIILMIIRRYEVAVHHDKAAEKQH